MLNVGKPLDDMELMKLARIRVGPFLLRLAIFVGLASLFVAAIVRSGGRGPLTFLAIFLLGLLYAHGVELQHQTLHNTAFPSKSWNRFTGVLLGLPMLVSFSDYQWSHLRHHRLLGTSQDREFFNYGYDRLTSLRPLLGHLFMVRHYRDVGGFIAAALIGRVKPGIKPENARKIRTEYQVMGICLLVAAALSVWLRTWLLVEAWLVPLLIAIPTHALVELPEHWGCDHDTLDVAHNTRTIRASGLAYWFTNGNNYHVEHHWLPAVPNNHFPYLHGKIIDQTPVDTYPGFFKRFFGELYRNTFTPRGGRQRDVAA